MGIGFSVFLLALGAILAFAVQDSTVYGIDLDVVGIILMAAGALGLVWSLVLLRAHRRDVVVEPRKESLTRIVEHDLPEDVLRRPTE
jgi:hypothetical protein